MDTTAIDMTVLILYRRSSLPLPDNMTTTGTELTPRDPPADSTTGMKGMVVIDTTVVIVHPTSVLEAHPPPALYRHPHTLRHLVLWKHQRKK